MLPADQRRVIEHIVDKVFIPMVMKRLQPFLIEFQDASLKTVEYSEIFGQPVVLPNPPKLDLAEPARKLIDYLVISLNEKDETQKEQKG